MESNGMGMNNIWSTIKSDSKKRNPLTNFVLYSIQIVSLIAIIVLLPNVFWSIGLLDDPDWNVWEDVYGGGYIPAFFALISVFICNIQILRWKKKGFSLMLISFFVICLPLMICEYEIFVTLLSFMYGGLLIYWLSLQFKRKGISTWKQCLGDFKVVNRAILAIAIFLTVILPPLIGYAIGFKGELYSKGCDCVDAHLVPHGYYKNIMGRDIAFSSLWRKEEWSRRSSAEKWFQVALHSANDYREEYVLATIYSSYICFLLKDENTEKAKKVYQEALEYVEAADLRKEIESDYILKSYLADYDAFVNNLVSTKKSNTQSRSKSSSAKSSIHQDTKQHQESHQHYEPQPHTVYEDVWFPCLTCHGDGKCTNCNGRGGYYIGAYYNVCGVCNGTGCCPWCGGRGQQKETRSKTVYY